MKEKENLASAFLIISAIFLYSFAASLDPFLNLYDERFHALVAKHLASHPFKPTLYDDPVVIMDYDYWDKYHIWLHKQPLFLWQMALTYKLFGPSEFAIRLPSVILGVVLVMVTLRSGKLLVGYRAGYISAILLLTCFYFFELVAGRQMVDHNDVSFIAYVSLSFWALIEYEHSSLKKRWIIFLGLFSGLAILNKWLPGLSVYFGWGILILSTKRTRYRQSRDLLIALLITTLIALPWQLYILLRFPAESMFEYQLNSKHFFEVIEGHGGGFWYYFENLDLLYGYAAAILIIPSFIVLWKQMKDKRMFIALAGIVLIVYLFFSIAKTKMPSFTLMVGMIVFISFGALADYLIQIIDNKLNRIWLGKLIFVVLILVLVMTRFEFHAIMEKHTFWSKDNLYSRALMHNKKVFTSLDLPQNTVLFNVKGQHYIDAMYYTGLPAYHDIPTYEQYTDLKVKGRVIAVFKTEALPDYLSSDSTVIVIDEKLDGYN